MNKDDIQRGLAVFGVSYIRRWLEPHYDELINLPFMARLKAANPGSKHAIEAILYALTALAENRMTDASPLGLIVKTLMMDAAPEISARLLRDARADLGACAGSASQPEQSVAKRFLALRDEELLALLIAIEAMDVSAKAKFLAFAAACSDDELRHFASLAPMQRTTLLGMHGNQQPPGGDAAPQFKEFVKDFWTVVKTGSQKTAELSLPMLSRYLVVLVQVLKTSAALLGMALVVCTASTFLGRWSLFGLVILLLGANGGLMYVGKQQEKHWLFVTGAVAGAIMALLAIVAAAGYAEAVFAIAVFFLVGLPTLAIVVVFIPVTTISEIVRSIMPEVHRTLVRSIQMLLTAFFGVLSFAMILLVFPPQNPVAFLFIVLAALVATVAAGLGLSRIGAAAFLRPPVILALGAVMLVTIGVMSMPNLRFALRELPKTVDLALVDEPIPVTFQSSDEIDFVETKTGVVRIWYAERKDGGYDLFRCQGVGPYFAKDGRKLKRADTDEIRLKIVNSVDQQAAAIAESLRQAEAARVEQQHLQAAQLAKEKEQQRLAEAEKQRRVAEEQKREQEQLAEEQRQANRRLEEERRAAQILADNERRASYLQAKSLASRVDLIVAVATVERLPMNALAATLVQHLKARGKSASNIVFSPEFITSGAFDLFFSGRGGADLHEMPVSAMGNSLFLARISVNSVSPGTTAAGLFTASVGVAFSIVSTSDGAVVDGFSISAVGAGTSGPDATSTALDRIITQMEEHGY